MINNDFYVKLGLLEEMGAEPQKQVNLCTLIVCVKIKDE